MRHVNFILGPIRLSLLLPDNKELIQEEKGKVIPDFLLLFLMFALLIVSLIQGSLQESFKAICSFCEDYTDTW